MPSSSNLYRVETVRVNRREVLQLTVVAGVGLAGPLLFGCDGEEEEEQGTPTALPATIGPLRAL